MRNWIATASTVTCRDMTFVITANTMAVAVIGVCSVPTKTCTTIQENFPMHRANDMKGKSMTDTERERINAICEVAGISEIDDLSDGFHTFRQLYYQRMMLFAVIVKQNHDRAWKSLRHEDGNLCFGGGWFIVGIDTPEGSYTYHYENKYFDLFDCKILDYGKHWDGHTEKDVTRLLSLQDVTDINVGRKNLIDRQQAIDAIDAIGHIAIMPDGDKCIRRSAVKYTLSMLPSAQKKGHWIFVHPLQEDDPGAYMCSECKVGNWEIDPESYFFCPYCGADMRKEEKDD